MRYELPAQPTAKTYDLEELVKLVLTGKVRIPHFQRAFRWDARDVRRLFDSILSGYPIGSLLLWRRPAPASRVRLGAITLDASEFQEALWVVDGQQRIISLANVLDDRGRSDRRFALAFDLMKADIVPLNEAGPLSEAGPLRAIPLSEMFDIGRVLAWFNERPDMIEYAEVANAAVKRLRTYAIPANVVDGADIRVLQDIFDRMNSFGKRLSRAEVFSALNAPTEDSAAGQLTIQMIAERADGELNFGLVDDDTVLRVILARRGPDVHREIRSEFLEDRQKSSEDPGETPDKAYAAGETALRSAMAFLQQDAGVPHFSFLPYRYLLVVLARFFAHHSAPHQRNRALLRRWFWRAALLGPEVFRGSATQAVRALCGRIRPDSASGSVQGLLEAVERPPPQMPNLERFRTNEATTRVLLAAMWNLDPRSLVTGEPFSQQELASALHGRASALDISREVVDRRVISAARRVSAANRLLLVGDDEPSTPFDGFFPAMHENLGEECAARVMASHAMDEACIGYLADGRIDEFLETRTTLMKAVLSGFLSRMCEWSLEDTPPLDELDLDETELRDDLAGARDASA